MTKNQKNICSKTLQEIKKICEENNHVYTPLNVFYRPSGQQFVKVAEDHNEKKNKRMHELRFFRNFTISQMLKEKI